MFYKRQDTQQAEGKHVKTAGGMETLVTLMKDERSITKSSSGFRTSSTQYAVRFMV